MLKIFSVRFKPRCRCDFETLSVGNFPRPWHMAVNPGQSTRRDGRHRLIWFPGSPSSVSLSLGARMVKDFTSSKGPVNFGLFSFAIRRCQALREVGCMVMVAAHSYHSIFRFILTLFLLFILSCFVFILFFLLFFLSFILSIFIYTWSFEIPCPIFAL